MGSTNAESSVQSPEDITSSLEPQQVTSTANLAQQSDTTMALRGATLLPPDVVDDIHTLPNSFKDGYLEDCGELGTTVIDKSLHPPSPPSSVSPPPNISYQQLPGSNSHLGDDGFISSKKKPCRGIRKGRGYGGIQKRLTVRKQVRFKDPISEIRLVHLQTPTAPNLGTPSTPAARAQAQAIRGIKWTGFGQHHLPRYYPAITKREALVKVEEDKFDKMFNRCATIKDTQYLVHFKDGPTGLEFAIPRSCLSPHLTKLADQGVVEHPGEKLSFEFETSTPAGLFLYTQTLCLGQILPHFIRGGWAGIVDRHKELGKDSWVSFLLAGLATAREASDPWFEGLVVEELANVSVEALGREALKEEGDEIKDGVEGENV